MSKKSSDQVRGKSRTTQLIRKSKLDAQIAVVPRVVIFLLSKDILSFMVDFFRTPIILNLRRVCRHYRQLIDDESFWEERSVGK